MSYLTKYSLRLASFQPPVRPGHPGYFTTKPRGQGTGLGLSIAYDIIKAHGGTIEVNSELKRGTEFVITLPI